MSGLDFDDNILYNIDRLYISKLSFDAQVQNGKIMQQLPTRKYVRALYWQKMAIKAEDLYKIFDQQPFFSSCPDSVMGQHLIADQQIGGSNPAQGQIFFSFFFYLVSKPDDKRRESWGNLGQFLLLGFFYVHFGPKAQNGYKTTQAEKSNLNFPIIFFFYHQA